MLKIILMGTALAMIISPFASLGTTDIALEWMDLDRQMFSVAIDLASGNETMIPPNHRHLDSLYSELERAGAEYHFAVERFSVSPEPDFTSLVAAEGDRPLDYIIAMHMSNARLVAAENTGQRDWMSKHHTAAKKYAALAAVALRRQAAEDEQQAASLQSQAFAVRRSPEEAAKVSEQLKQHGLSEVHRGLLKESGLTPEEITAYERKVQGTPPGDLGISIVELYQKIAKARQDLAASLEQFAGDRETISGQLGQSFVVGNPHDRDEVVHLVLRRAAMPPEWTLSLVEVEPTGGKSAQRLEVVEAGRQYQVRLPAKGSIRMASIVTPVGTVAENTTARWAVEGRIGEELLGGIVQEVNVPAFLPNLELPPVAAPTPVAVTVPTPDPPPAEPQRPIVLWLGAGGLFLSVALILLLYRRKKR